MTTRLFIMPHRITIVAVLSFKCSSLCLKVELTRLLIRTRAITTMDITIQMMAV